MPIPDGAAITADQPVGTRLTADATTDAVRQAEVARSHMENMVAWIISAVLVATG